MDLLGDSQPLACEQSSPKHGQLSAAFVGFVEVYAVGAVSNNGWVTGLPSVMCFSPILLLQKNMWRNV